MAAPPSPQTDPSLAAGQPALQLRGASGARLASGPEQRMTFYGLDWAAYQQMKGLLSDRSHARFTYDRGTLELTIPSEPHECYGRLIETLGQQDEVVAGLAFRAWIRKFNPGSEASP